MPGLKAFFVSLILCILTIQTLVAQETPKENIQQKNEDFLILGNLDSANHYLAKLDEGEYKNQLKELVNSGSQKPSAAALKAFLISTQKRYNGNNALELHKYLKSVYPYPKNKFELEYLLVINSSMITLRNNGLLAEANKENELMSKYVAQFDQENIKVKKAIYYTRMHHLIMMLIQNKYQEGVKLGKELEAYAESLNDTSLMINAKFNLADFYVSLKMAKEYIEVSEECYRLDSMRAKKSHLYVYNIDHLLSVYGYMGGYEAKSWALLNELYHQPEYRNDALNLHILFLRHLPPNSPYVDSMLNRYQKPNVVEFCFFADSAGKTTLDKMDQFKQTTDLVFIMAAHNFPEKGLKRAIGLVNETRQFYTNKMSEDLAKYQTQKVEQAKQLEVQAEQEKTKLYSTAAILVSVLLVLAIIGFYLSFRNGQKLKKQKQQIEAQKLEVEKQRNAIAERDKEKEVLLKEIHHRVKNNFQIVSGLLEMQTRDIEDDKAKEIAIDGQNRVKSMSLIHQRLYQNNDLKVNIKEYIEQLIQEISLVYDIDEKAQVKLNIISTDFDVDTAIPLGLILNELITNAFKYGISENKNQIEVELNTKASEGYTLSVKDQGAGISESVNLEESTSIGMRLVNILSDQLDGSLRYVFNNGAQFIVDFKEK